MRERAEQRVEDAVPVGASMLTDVALSLDDAGIGELCWFSWDELLEYDNDQSPGGLDKIQALEKSAGFSVQGEKQSTWKARIQCKRTHVEVHTQEAQTESHGHHKSLFLYFYCFWRILARGDDRKSLLSLLTT